MMQKPVLMIGDANFDKVIRLPATDSGIDTLRDLVPKLHAGGTVGNAAIAIARLGINVTLACAVGGDGYGDFVLRALADAGVDIRHAHVVQDRFTLTVTVVIDRSGQRYFAIFPPDNPATLFYPSNKLDIDSITQARWLHACGWLAGYSPIGDVILQAMTQAGRAGIPISLDLNLRLRPGSDTLPESYREAVYRAVELSDYVLGSGTDEFTLLTGANDPIEGAMTLAAGKRTVIARFGPDGAIVVTASGDVIPVPAFKTEVVDTLGAGDVYDAGFITAMLEGKSVVEAARWGNALAAISVAHEGAAGHLTREGLETLLASQSTEKTEVR